MGISIGEMSVTIGANISSFTTAMAKVDTTFKNFQKGVGQVQSATTKFSEGIEKSVKGVGGFADKIKSNITGLVGFSAQLGMGIIGLKGLAEGAMSATQALFGPSAAMEQNTIAFTQMLGSGKKAKAFLDDMQRFAAQTPFEFQDLVVASKRLLAFGFSAQQVKPMMTAIGDATAGLGLGQDGIDRITLALGQMSAKGKVSAEEMNQLTETGVGGWQMLADSMHLSVAQVMQLSSQGKLASKDAIPMLLAGMEKAFGGQMAGQATTLNGIISNIQDNVSQAGLAFMAPIFDQVKDKFKAIGDVLASPQFKQFATVAGEWVGKGLTSVVNFINTNVKPAFDWLVKTVKIFLDQMSKTGDIQKLVGALGNLFNALSPLSIIGQITGHVKDFTSQAGSSQTTADALKGTIENLTNTVNTLADGIRNTTEFFKSNSIQAQAVKDLMIGLGVAIAAIGIGQFLLALPMLLIGLASWAVGAWTAAAGMIALTWPIILIVAGIALLVAGIILLVQHWGDVTAFMSDTWGRFSGWFMQTLGAIGAWFMGIFGAIGAFFVGWGQSIAAFFTGIWNAVLGFLVGVGTAIYNAIIAPFVNFVVGVATVLAPFILYVMQVFATISNIIFALIMIAVNFVIGAFMGLVSVTVGAFVALYNAVAGPLGTARDFIVAVIAFCVAWVQERWAYFQAITSAAFGYVWGIISGKFNQIKDTVMGAISYVVGIISGKWNEIKQTAIAYWSAFQALIAYYWNLVSTTVMNKVASIKEQLLSPFKAAKDAIGGIIKGFVNGMIGGLNTGLDRTEKFLNGFGDALNGIAEKLNIKPIIKHVTLPRVPQYASGTGFHPGGPAIVGEEGPELVMLGRGASVLPNKQTMQLLGSMGLPGYAGGVGDALGGFWDWASSGASALLNKALEAFHVGAPQLPGVLSDLGGGVLSKLKDAAVGWVSSILPKFSWGNGGGGNTGSLNIPDMLKRWIMQAIGLTGAPGDWAGPLSVIAMHESGGNPLARNDWDSNAKAGIPSQGLFQTIPPTFAAYALPGYNTNILDPVQNAAAAIRYIQARYGSVWNVPGIVAMSQGGAYVGYANGGIISEPIVGMGLTSGKRYAFGENEAEAIVPRSKWGAGSNQPIELHAHIHVGTKEIAEEIITEYRWKSGNRS